MGLTDPSFMTKMGSEFPLSPPAALKLLTRAADTKKEWHSNAQGVVRQAKAEAANIVRIL